MLFIYPGMLLCHSMADASDPLHAGCWISRGGYKFEVIVRLTVVSQLKLHPGTKYGDVVVWSPNSEVDRLLTSPTH